MAQAARSWYDTGAARNAWIQHVLPGGTQRFPQDGLAASTTGAAVELRLSAGAAYLSAADEYVVAFERSNPGQSQYGLGAQRITAEGALLWGATGEGLELIPINSGLHKSFVSVMPAPSSDAVIAWIEYRGANNPMVIQATRIDEAGAAVWSPAFLDVASAETTKGRLMLSGVVGSDMLVATWHDNASGSNDILAQNINMNGTLGPVACPGDVDASGDVDLSDLAILLANFGTPGGASPANGDLDSDGDVDLGDLAILLANFGSTCS